MIDELTSQYNVEADRITLARLASWSSVAMEDEIAGVDSRPLTLQAWVDLKASGNALFCEQTPSLGDFIAYVWRNHPGYSSTDNRRTKRIKKRIIKSITRQDPVTVTTAIYEHLEAAFSESPEVPGSSPVTGFPFAMGVVYAVDEIAHRYGISPFKVMQMPMTQIYQLQKVIGHINNPKHKPAQPTGLRRISGKILEEMNNG